MDTKQTFKDNCSCLQNLKKTTLIFYLFMINYNKIVLVHCDIGPYLLALIGFQYCKLGYRFFPNF